MKLSRHPWFRCTFCVCCSALQWVAVCCSVLQCCYNQSFMSSWADSLNSDAPFACVAEFYRVLQCVAVCCSVAIINVFTASSVDSLNSAARFACIAVCCSVLQWVAVCCNVLQYCNNKCFTSSSVDLLDSDAPFLWQDSFIRVTWLTHNRAMTHSYVRHVHSYMQRVHSYVWHKAANNPLLTSGSAVCCNMLYCAAVCCSMLQCVAVLQ